MTVPDLAPRKPPRQQRAQFTVDVILEAATRVLTRGGLPDLTTNRVAEVAGVSIGSLYQYFPNKAALVAALIERAQDQFATEVERLVAATETLSLREALRGFAAFAVRQQYETPLLAAALDEAELRLPIAAVLRRAERRMLTAIEELARLQGATNPATAARDLFLITKALVEADVGDPNGPPLDLVDRVLCATGGYLAEACTAVV